MIKLSIEWIELDSEGEICHGCGKEIKGKKYTMMISFGDPRYFPSEPLDCIYCLACYEEFNKPVQN